MSEGFGAIGYKKKRDSSSSSSSSSRSNSSTRANRANAGAASAAAAASALAGDDKKIRGSPRQELLRQQQQQEAEKTAIANATTGSFMVRKAPPVALSAHTAKASAMEEENLDSPSTTNRNQQKQQSDDNRRLQNEQQKPLRHQQTTPTATTATTSSSLSTTVLKKPAAEAAAFVSSSSPPSNGQLAASSTQSSSSFSASASTSAAPAAPAAAASSFSSSGIVSNASFTMVKKNIAPGAGSSSPPDEGFTATSRTAGTLRGNNADAKAHERQQFVAEQQQRRAAAALAAQQAGSPGQPRMSLEEVADDNNFGNDVQGGTGNGNSSRSQQPPFRRDSNLGVGFAGLARVDELHKMWLTHAHSLYMFCTSHVLHWPSTCVEWLADSRREIPTRDFSIAQVAVGTFAVDADVVFPGSAMNEQQRRRSATTRSPAATTAPQQQQQSKQKKARRCNGDDDDDDDDENNRNAFSDQEKDDNDDSFFKQQERQQEQQQQPYKVLHHTRNLRDKEKQNYLNIYRVFLHCNPDLDQENDDVEEGAAAFRGTRGRFQDVAPLMPRHQRVLTDGPVINIASNPNLPTALCFRGLTPEVHIVDIARRPLEPDTDVFAADIHLVGHHAPGRGMQWAPDNSKRILTSDNDGIVQLWNIGAHLSNVGESFKSTYLAPVLSLRGHHAPCDNVTWHGSQPNLCASCARDGEMIVWDLRSKLSAKRLNATALLVRAMGPAAAASASESLSKTLAAPERTTHEHIRQRNMVHRGGALYDIAFHPNADFLLATAGADRVVRVWDVRNFKEPCSILVGHTGEVRGVRWAPFNDTVLMSYDTDGGVFCWDIAKRFSNVNEDGQVTVAQDDGTCSCDMVFRHLGHTGVVRDAKWAPFDEDEWTVASVDENNMLQLWAPHPDIYNDDVGGVEDVDDVI